MIKFLFGMKYMIAQISKESEGKLSIKAYDLLSRSTAFQWATSLTRWLLDFGAPQPG